MKSIWFHIFLIIFLVLLVLVMIFPDTLPSLLVFSFIGFIVLAITKNEASIKAQKLKQLKEEQEALEEELRVQRIKEQMEQNTREAQELIKTLVGHIPCYIINNENPTALENSNTKNISDFPEIKLKEINSRTNKELISNFVVIDVETTGLSPLYDDIIEISAIKYIEFEPIEKFTTLINPQRAIPKEASDINRITDDMVVDKPLIDDVAVDLLNFVGEYPLVGQNLIFDLKFFHYNNIDLISNRKLYDTLTISRAKISKDRISNYKLATLCDYANIFVRDLHRSIYDCYATGELFKWLLDNFTY